MIADTLMKLRGGNRTSVESLNFMCSTHHQHIISLGMDFVMDCVTTETRSGSSIPSSYIADAKTYSAAICRSPKRKRV